MPLLEAICDCSSCSIRGKPVEHFYHHFDDTPLPCAECGSPTRRIASRFGVIWTGPISARYNDRDSANAHQEGHWAWRRRSSKSGKPEPIFLNDWQQQKEFCKEEGLANPREMPRNFEIAADGKTVKSSVGMPGCEI